MNTNWKTVRVFISSTFLDMQAERDHLVRFVFPRLREQLLLQRIHLVDVDLRWGITDEQDALEASLEIIDECRPRFLCILGGRYGWVPIGKTRSITAEEVHYGVLDRTLKDRGYSYFYFRDDAVTATMVETAPGEFREPQGSENHKRLTELKQAIVSSGLNTFLYQAQWDNENRRLIGLKTFANHIFDDLLASMKSDPELRDRFLTDRVEQFDEFTEDNDAMEAFVEERCERFVLGSRGTVFNELLVYLGSTCANGYICLTGTSGSGKSAILSYLSKNISLNSQTSTILIRHFVGASPGSTNIRRTLRRICHELKVNCADITDDIPDDLEKLRPAFLNFLQKACALHLVVILLDAVNQFDAASHSILLNWLPEEPPVNLRIILSVPPGPVLEELRLLHRKLREIDLKPLTLSDGEAIIEQFCKRFRKRFEPAQFTLLLSKTDAGIPLYLLAALEELRTLGFYNEITLRIAELPSTILELFTWILMRLENDDGFRDAVGQRVGHELVSRFAKLLGVSRYGLSQQELTDLLDIGDPQGNVAALLYLLRPYLMRRGELLDFYHDHFRTAAKETWLKTESEVKTVHTQIADYLRQRADPRHNQHWELNPRLLMELPFHVACGTRESELLELFSQLAFLAARVATGQVYEQIADYSLAGSPLLSVLIPWRDFLQKHTKRLSDHPTMLVALANHEGFLEARAQALNIPWYKPWLRTSREQMPTEKTKGPEGLQVQVMGSIEFPWGRVSCIAPQQSLAFCLEQLGTIRVFDLNEMRQTNALLSIRRDRPLVLACASDATSVAIFYETGTAELYRYRCGKDKWLASIELVVEFSFYLPEYENPIVVWHKGTFWFQKKADVIASISIESPCALEETLPVGQHGELAALIFSDSARLVAIRQGSDTLLLGSSGPPLRRRAAYIMSACIYGEREAAIAFTDGTLVVFELGDTLTVKVEVHVGMLRGAIGWDGSRLLWLNETGGFCAWNPAEASLLSVQDNQEVFPTHLNILPYQWFLRPDNSILLCTSHSLVMFRVLYGGAATDGHLEGIFGGPIWRTVRKRGKDQQLLEKQPLREVLLGRGVMGRLYCALDGKGRFFAASGNGLGLVFDLSTLQSTQLQGCPPGINIAVGEDRGGCWFTDRIGDIYFANTTGQFICAAKIGLPDVHGSLIENCDDYLVWVGYSSKYFPETGNEPARTFIFYSKIQGNPPKLERLSDQYRHPREGLCVAICYNQVDKKIVTLWVKETNGIETYHLRVGPLKEFIHWQFEDIDVIGLGKFRFIQAELSANGRFLGVVNIAGEISYLCVATGRVIATLSGSAPFTNIAPGPEGSEFWLVESQANIYKCELIEGKT